MTDEKPTDPRPAALVSMVVERLRVEGIDVTDSLEGRLRSALNERFLAALGKFDSELRRGIALAIGRGAAGFCQLAGDVSGGRIRFDVRAIDAISEAAAAAAAKRNGES